MILDCYFKFEFCFVEVDFSKLFKVVERIVGVCVGIRLFLELGLIWMLCK